MILCSAPTAVHGAEPCPRKKGHDGEHYWWIPWEDGNGTWRVDVYLGDLSDPSTPTRTRLVKGAFREPPEAADVHELLVLVSPLWKVAKAAQTPVSEPFPVSRALSPRITRLPRGMVLVHG